MDTTAKADAAAAWLKVNETILPSHVQLAVDLLIDGYLELRCKNPEPDDDA